MTKKLIIIISAILAVGLIAATILIIFNKSKSDDNVSGGNIIVSQVSFDGSKWVVTYDDERDSFKVLKDNIWVEERRAKEENIKTEYMNLPKVETAKDIDKGNPITDGAYKSNLVSSLEYLNYLLSQNYKEELRAITPKFLEVYMRRGESNAFTRLIITEEYIIISGTDEVPFEIDNYIL